MDARSPGLFEAGAPRPIAEILRPKSLAEVVGQEHLLGPEGPIGRMVRQKRVASMILWGPAGVGKTTIARLLADAADLEYEAISAVFSGIADIRKAIEAAESRFGAGRSTLLFVDEAHRFNKAQQDAFLPYVERGVVRLVGATTENPSFSINDALLSRCQVMALRRLDDDALDALLDRAEAHFGRPLPLEPLARATLRAMADGDGRHLLTLAEEVAGLPPAPKLGPEDLLRALQRRAPQHDKGADGHYNLASAFQKSIRGSDADAALYWLARMLAAGEDVRFILRRLTVIASEDVGLADPQAIVVAAAAADAVERLGLPEGEHALAELTLYLATAPKSNRAYAALKAAKQHVLATGSPPPTRRIVNAPTQLMRDMGFKDGYQYDHDAKDAFSGQDFFPDGMARPRFYEPVERGFEREVKKRLDWWTRLRAERGQEKA